MCFRHCSHENRKTSEATDCEIIFFGGKSLYTELSVYHPGVFTKLNKMVFTSQTHLFIIVLNVLMYPGMVNTKFKIIASQARTINLYRNSGSKLFKCNANIYFNKQCLAKKVIPK